VLEVPRGIEYSGSNIWLDLETGRITPIVNPENIDRGGYIASPNGQRLGYWEITLGGDGSYSAMSFVVADPTGQVLNKVPGDVEHWDAFYWLDNDQVVIGFYIEPMILDPISGEAFNTTEWYAQSPGGMLEISFKTWEANGSFDSWRTRILYIMYDLSMVLWDLEAEQIVATDPPVKIKANLFHIPLSRPKWSPDNVQVVFAYPVSEESPLEQELYSLSRDGVLSRLTYLNEYYSQVEIKHFSWSPDGRYIAFFFEDLSEPDPVEQFAVLDITTLEIKGYCNVSGKASASPDPVWSPYGNMVLVSQVENETTQNTILIDIVHDVAVLIAEGVIPGAWLVENEP